MTSHCCFNFYRLLLTLALQLSSYEIISEKALHGHILPHCKALSTPQDLRYAVFALQTAPYAGQILLTHVKELRQACLVNIRADSREIALTLRTGASIKLAIDPCYPNVSYHVFILFVFYFCKYYFAVLF